MVGLSLVEAYEQVGIKLHLPHLRSQIEAQMKLITLGQRKCEEVMEEAVTECKKIFSRVLEHEIRLKEILRERMAHNSQLPSLKIEEAAIADASNETLTAE